MLKKILRIIGWTAGGLLGLVVALYLIALAINWRDQAPSATAARFEALYRDRQAVADEDNGFVYAMGFDVPAGENPRQMGAKRLAWMQAAAGQPLDMNQDPLGVPENRQAKRPASVKAFLDACAPESTHCAAAFDASAAVLDQWMATEGWLLERYQVLIAHPGWREVVPTDAAMPLPSYGAVATGQRLLLLKAKSLADQNDLAGTRELLRSDLQFWRRVLESSDILISKMMATAALNRHFEWGNLILRSFKSDSAAQAVPDEWRAEFSDAERSMSRCLVGEWIFTSAILRNTGGHDFPNVEDSLVSKLARRLYQPQDSINRYAQYYAELAEILDAPLSQYEGAVKQMDELAERTASDAFPSASVYNIFGRWLIAIGGSYFGSYPRRVGDIEGVRRAALTAVTLRATHVTPAAVAAALQTDALRNPYNDRPFTWDEQNGAIVFTGIETSARGTHRIYY